MHRRAFVTGLGAVLAAPLAAEAQLSSNLYRVGLLIGASEAFIAPYIEIFRQALRALGYVDGQNIAFDSRCADGHYDRLRALAAEPIQLKMDLLVTEGTPPTRAATQATTTIPIVMTVTGDPVAAGLVTNLARPGGN
jgi:putative ABC transport system substrate-binding protein